MGKDQEFLEAARNGNVGVVEKLLNSKAKRGGPLASLRRGPGSNVQDSSGYSALHHAALNGHREIVVLLLEHEASPNIVDSKGSSPLHLAAWAGHSDIVRLLLTTGVRVTQIDLRNKDNESALHFAAQYGHTAVVSLLLKYGADPNYRNVRDETPLDLAAQYGRLETVELLLQTHPELVETYRNQPQGTGSSILKTSPLHAASRNGHRAVVDLLLAVGFPANVLTSTGTALHEASLCGKVDVVRRLLEAGVDVSLKDNNGLSALRIVQDLPTPVAQEIASLIRSSALSAESFDDFRGVPIRYPSKSTILSPDSPYENVSLASNGYRRESQMSASSCASTGADSFITLPRRRTHKPSISSTYSQKSDGSQSVYEIPPPPRSLPWAQQQAQQQNNTQSHAFRHRRVESEAGASEKRSSSHSDLLDDDSAFGPPDDMMSRSYDGRSLEFLSLTDASERAHKTPFNRSSHIRHSADQYLPMTASSGTKISPNPPQKPPRKLQGMSVHFESLPRSAGRQRVTSCNVEPATATTPAPLQPQQAKSAAPGYELVYLARTGTRADEPRFRVHSQYVDMSVGSQAPSYENVEQRLPPRSAGLRDADENAVYDFPRKLGGPKAYENVNVHPVTERKVSSTPPESSSTTASSVSSVSCKSTPDSPSQLPFQPPTPDHPPPSAHLAEQSIHLRIRPLSEEFKRTSRDMETETEEELFLTVASNGCDSVESQDASLSVSLSERSLSTDHIEEVTSDQPFEGLKKGSMSDAKRPPERPNSLIPPSSPLQRTPAGLSGESMPQKQQPEPADGSASPGGNCATRSSLTVLSPFDEQEEWIKILEILNTCSSGLESADGATNFVGDVQRELQNRLDAKIENGSGADAAHRNKEDVIEAPVSTHDHQPDTIADWLLSLGLQHYLGLMVSNGFDDVDFLGDGIVDDASLLEIGITDPEHRRRLVQTAAKFKTPLYKMQSVARPTTVEEWLHLIRLNRYAEQFRKNKFDDMERVSRIWEVELTTVVEIRLVGHLRRILVSLGNQHAVQHPHRSSTTSASFHSVRTPSQKAQGSMPTPSHVKNEAQKVTQTEDLSALTSDLQKISTNIARLEDEISQKMLETISDVSHYGTLKSSSSTLRRKARPAPPPPANDNKPSYQTLERVLDDIDVRHPSELVIGIAKTVATQWRHKPQHLLRPGVCYEAEYLGSTLVKHVRGTESTKRSIQKLKKKYAADSSKCANIVLAISLSGVQFLDPVRQETICKHEIRNINWACQDAEDLTHFAYITKDLQSEQDRHHCHVFQVPTMDLATEIILTLGQAFEVAYQLVLREDILFSPSSVPSQPITVPLSSAMASAVPGVSPTSVTASKPVLPVTSPVSQQQQPPAPATADNNPTANCRKIGPKPTVLPKPKLGTAVLGQRSASTTAPPPSASAGRNLSHSRSHTSVDTLPDRSIHDARLQSESNLVGLQATKASSAKAAGISTSASTTSMTSTGSGRAPLAAKDEL